MGRKIVIEPCFNEAHMAPMHIRNMCEYFNPDVYIIAEGAFPRGPENQMGDKEYDSFVEEYTLDGVRSFDFLKLKQEVEQCKIDFPDTEFKLVEMEYPKNQQTSDTYYQLYVTLLSSLNIEPDDIIMPSETDMFFTKKQADDCLVVMKDMLPNSGFGSAYDNFFESPFVQKGTRIGRSIAFRYGNGELYKYMMKNILQERECMKLIPIYDMNAFHYEWMRPGKYFEMRVKQVPRKWSDEFLKARDLIREKPFNLADRLKTEIKQRWTFELKVIPLNIEDHPKHIHQHESFKYYYDY